GAPGAHRTPCHRVIRIRIYLVTQRRGTRGMQGVGTMSLKQLAGSSAKMVGVVVACGLAVASAPQGASGSTDPYASYPSSMTISGVCRDFRAKNLPGGHPDMELNPPNGYAIFSGIVADNLNASGMPVFASTGYKVTTQAVDSQNRPIIGAKSYITP